MMTASQAIYAARLIAAQIILMFALAPISFLAVPQLPDPGESGW